ncbi:MAG: hypothetical protein ACLKAK_07305 [Alkaliphilus sp.]
MKALDSVIIKYQNTEYRLVKDEVLPEEMPESLVEILIKNKYLEQQKVKKQPGNKKGVS